MGFPFFFLNLTFYSIFISKKCLAALRTFLVTTSDLIFPFFVSSLLDLLTNIELTSFRSRSEISFLASLRHVLFHWVYRSLLTNTLFRSICGSSSGLKMSGCFVFLGSTEIPFSARSPKFKKDRLDLGPYMMDFGNCRTRGSSTRSGVLLGSKKLNLGATLTGTIGVGLEGLICKKLIRGL